VARRYPDPVTSDRSLLSGSGANEVKKIKFFVSTPVIFATADPERVRALLPTSPILEKPFSSTQFAAPVGQGLVAAA